MLEHFDALTGNEKDVVHDIYTTTLNVRMASVESALNAEYEESVGLIRDANRLFLNNMRGLWEAVKLLAR